MHPYDMTPFLAADGYPLSAPEPSHEAREWKKRVHKKLDDLWEVTESQILSRDIVKNYVSNLHGLMSEMPSQSSQEGAQD